MGISKREAVYQGPVGISVAVIICLLLSVWLLGHEGPNLILKSQLFSLALKESFIPVIAQLLLKFIFPQAPESGLCPVTSQATTSFAPSATYVGVPRALPYSLEFICHFPISSQLCRCLSRFGLQAPAAFWPLSLRFCLLAWHISLDVPAGWGYSLCLKPYSPVSSAYVTPSSRWPRLQVSRFQFILTSQPLPFISHNLPVLPLLF